MQLVDSGELVARYVLSPKEEASGQHFDTFQRAVLHNMRADIAMQKLNQVFTPDAIVEYAQIEAMYTAQIDLLTALLNPLTANPQENTNG